jgi:hypothetical protein
VTSATVSRSALFMPSRYTDGDEDEGYRRNPG